MGKKFKEANPWYIPVKFCLVGVIVSEMFKKLLMLKRI
jgi:hypothetical protein